VSLRRWHLQAAAFHMEALLLTLERGNTRLQAFLEEANQALDAGGDPPPRLVALARRILARVQ
jgi:hypothetical protein